MSHNRCVPLFGAAVLALSAGSAQANPPAPAVSPALQHVVDRPLILFSTHGSIAFTLTYRSNGVMEFVEMRYLAQPEDKRAGSRHGSRRWVERDGHACHVSKGYLTCFDLSKITNGGMQRAPGKAVAPDGKVLEQFVYEGVLLSRDDYLP